MKEKYFSPECKFFKILLEGMIALSDPLFINPYVNSEGQPEELEW